MNPTRAFITALCLLITTVPGIALSSSVAAAPAAAAAANSRGSAAGTALPAAALSAAAARTTARAGAFCRSADAGKTAYSAKGDLLRCATTATDSRYRWRTVVK